MFTARSVERDFAIRSDYTFMLAVISLMFVAMAGIGAIVTGALLFGFVMSASAIRKIKKGALFTDWPYSLRRTPGR